MRCYKHCIGNQLRFCVTNKNNEQIYGKVSPVRLRAHWLKQHSYHNAIAAKWRRELRSSNLSSYKIQSVRGRNKGIKTYAHTCTIVHIVHTHSNKNVVYFMTPEYQAWFSVGFYDYWWIIWVKIVRSRNTKFGLIVIWRLICIHGGGEIICFCLPYGKYYDSTMPFFSSTNLDSVKIQWQQQHQWQ